MLTYLNEYAERTEITNEQDTVIWYKVNEIVESLSEEEFNEMLETVSAYVYYDIGKKRVKQIARRFGVEWQALVMWYTVEEE